MADTIKTNRNPAGDSVVRRLLVLTVLLVLAMGTVAFAAISPPPQHGQVDISIDVKPWVRISVPSTLTIEFIGESGGFKDFVAKVRGISGMSSPVPLAQTLSSTQTSVLPIKHRSIT